MDYLVTDRDVDPKRIAALGHSRNGKTALLAAAFDERIAMAFPHQAGCGGTAPSRSKIGRVRQSHQRPLPALVQRRVQEIQRRAGALAVRPELPWWPCAPRARCSSPPHRKINGPTPPASSRSCRPPTRFIAFWARKDWRPRKCRRKANWSPVRLGYYIREGKHSMTADDWRVFMDFADRQLGRQK